MKYEVRTDEQGEVILKLGLNHSISFIPPISVEEIILGVTMLIEKTVGISTFEMVQAVMAELDGVEKEDG